ncbi:hypothetical protein [Amycolatopsis lexingtonensis]|uniref:hypothetical protein n=1 Tax=Amycolatopsis lexingtonensis TaxID=218822 RepID=UPI003F6EDC51
MNRRTRSVALGGLLLGGAFFISACSSISSGTVTGKEYEPESTWFSQDCMSYDTKMNCRFYMPTAHTDPECWRLDLVQGEDDGSVCVSKQDYNSYGAGDFYPRGAAK